MNFARVPKKRPKLCAKTIRERDGNRCQYTDELLKPEEGSLVHVVPRSRARRAARAEGTAGLGAHSQCAQHS